MRVRDLTSVNVSASAKIPCDLCGGRAVVDAKTRGGPWAYLCEDCFPIYGIRLGLGFGQKLEKGLDKPTPGDISRQKGAKS